MLSENKTVGEVIREAREKKGLSRNQLSKLAQVSHTELARVESGERDFPNPRRLRRISKFIDVDYNDLMYMAGLGSKISPLNHFIIDYYDNLKGQQIRDAKQAIDATIENNNVIIASFKIIIDSKTLDQKYSDFLSETIEDLEYQNNMSLEILKLLNSNIIKERLNYEGEWF